MKEPGMPKADFIMGLILMAFSLLIVVESLKLPRFEKDWGGFYAAPGFVPLILGITLFAMSLALFVRAVKKQGYKIVERNYRSRAGEIDIVAMDRVTLVFVEVKTRRSRSFGSPKWAVTPKKQKAISMAALYYLKMTGQPNADARFDVVSILDIDESLEIELVRNAFDLAYP